jgi:lipopolysaccharide export system permease protein
MLDRYIGRAVIGHTLVVFSVLLMIYFFSTLVSEMGYVGKGHYTAVNALLYSLMLIPRQAYELFPMVALLGSMLGLGSLANSSELTVMRAAGISVKRVAGSVLKAGLIMIVVVIAIGEGVAPELEKTAHVQRLKAMAKSISVNTSSGMWAKDGDSFIAIDKLNPGGDASGVTLYRMTGQKMQEIAMATSAHYDRGVWYLNNVHRTLFTDEGVKVEQQAEAEWETGLTPDVINLASMPPENLAIWELNEYIGYLRENGLASQRYQVALWVRIMAPLATSVMILMALPFVFGSTRALGVGARIMIGAMIGIVFYLFNSVFSRIGIVYDIPPELSAAIPTVLVFSVWFWMMRRVR